MSDALEELKDKLLASLEGADLSDTDPDGELAKLTAAAKSLEIDFSKPAWSFADSNQAESIPRSIGTYRILGILGKGGMGVVYKAEQETPLKRIVALKVVRKEIASKESIARFEHECMALARLDHPNIASVIDHGKDENGQPFVAMELVDGVSVTEYARENQLTIPTRLQLFIDICRGVAHAHACGIIHRDLKPSNIIVIEQNGKLHPKIIDFGIAKVIDLDTEQRLTLTQQVFGTLEYVSPEVIDYGAAVADARSDVYSLGCILYELLTGVPPVDLSEARLAGMLSAIGTLRHAVIAKPSARAGELRAQHSDLPKLAAGELDCITLHALEREPQDRYQSPMAMADDVERHLAFQPIQASPPSIARVLTKFCRRHRIIVAATAAVLLSLIGGLAFSVFNYQQAETSRRLAVEAQADSARALELLSEAAMLANTYDAQGKARLAELGSRIESVLADADFQAAEPKYQLQIMLAASYRSQGKYSAANRVLKQAQIATQEPWANLDQRFQVAILLAENAIDLHAPEVAEEFARDACTVASNYEASPKRDRQQARSDFVLANALTIAGKLDQAAQIYSKVLENDSATSEVDAELTRARAEVMLASILVRQGKSDEAYQHSSSGYSSYLSRYGTSHSQSLMSGHNHAIILTTLDRDQEAIDVFNQVLLGRERVLGNEHPDTLMTRTMLASALARQSQAAEAVELFRSVLASGDESSRELAPVHALAAKGLMKFQAKQELYEEAETTAQKHISFTHLASGPGKDVEVARLRLAMIYIDSQQYTKASVAASEAYEALASMLGEQHRLTKVAAQTAANAHEKLGNIE